jgi:hypothetical protein
MTVHASRQHLRATNTLSRAYRQHQSIADIQVGFRSRRNFAVSIGTPRCDQLNHVEPRVELGICIA